MANWKEKVVLDQEFLEVNNKDLNRSDFSYCLASRSYSKDEKGEQSKEFLMQKSFGNVFSIS